MLRQVRDALEGSETFSFWASSERRNLQQHPRVPLYLASRDSGGCSQEGQQISSAELLPLSTPSGGEPRLHEVAQPVQRTLGVERHPWCGMLGPAGLSRSHASGQGRHMCHALSAAGRPAACHAPITWWQPVATGRFWQFSHQQPVCMA